MPAILQNPAHLHLLLNHLPIAGLAVAALGLFLALLARNRGAQIISLCLIILTSAAAWPVYVTGENAYKSIRGIADDAGSDWLDTHIDRADETIWYFAVPPAFALLAMFLPRKFPSSAVPLLVVTLLAALVCLGLAAYIADAGGQIRHPEFRKSATLP
ncbi:MAG: hypothetical protein ABIT76_14765 [Chthoniobacterales bacterium]